jgi:8-oxo-dGTP pyrophosphatase MutT (NUDIX family)
LGTLLEKIKRQSFWLVYNTCLVLYRTFPVFGALRSSLAIIRNGDQFLVMLRNDGRGVCFPGGIAGWRENEESAVRREVKEETGMTATSVTFRMRYRSTADLPCLISVFEVEATGELQTSWEGTLHWMTIPEIEKQILKSQRPALEEAKKISPDTRSGDALTT